MVSYDGTDSTVHYDHIPPIPCIGPTFHQLGWNPCDVIMHKWETGTYPQPLQRKI